MTKFEKYLIEVQSTNEIEWNKPLYHGTSLKIAKKILKTNQFITSSGVDEIGSGIYLHPSMNRTSPWVKLSSKNDNGAFIEVFFKQPLKLAIYKPRTNQRDLMEQGFMGTYDKDGYTQVPHQILLFTKKIIGSNSPDLNNDIIDWGKTKIINYDDDIHGYLNADKEEKQYYF